MAHAENDVTIPRPAADVWAYLADLDNVSSWIPAVKRVEHVAGEAGAAGAAYTADVEVGGGTRSGRLRIVSAEPTERLALSIDASPIRIDGVVTLEEQAGATRVAVMLDAPTTGLLRLMDGPIQQALQDTLGMLPTLADVIP